MTFIPNVVGTVDANNSTSQVLAPSGSFTGTVTAVPQYNTVSLYVTATASSAVNGLQILVSTDNTTWNTLSQCTIANASSSIPYVNTYQLSTQYYKIAYTNGSSASTVVIQSILNNTGALVNINAPTYSQLNSTTSTVLTNGVSFNGVFEEVSRYSQIRMNITASASSSTFSFTYYFSQGNDSIRFGHSLYECPRSPICLFCPLCLFLLIMI